MANNTKLGSLEFEIRKVDLLYQQNVGGLIAVLLNSSVYIYISRTSVSTTFLGIWFAILLSSVVARIVTMKKWHQTKDQIRNLAETKIWLYLMFLYLLISGFSWGALGFIVGDKPLVVQITTALVLSCMMAGALITYVSYRRAVACVILPACLGWTIGYLTSDQPHHIIIGLLVLGYASLLTFLSKNLNFSVLNSLSLDVDLKTSEERLRMSMESSEALTWDWDLANDEFHCQGNINLFPGGAEQLKSLLRPAIEKQMDLDVEHIVQEKDQTYHHIAIRGKPIKSKSGKVLRMAGICWDVTAKRTEDILRRERDLHEAANQAKSVFLANASHEIRTPLSAILGFTDALLRSPDLTKDDRHDVESIYRQGNYMGSLIHDLLDLSKIETNRLYVQKAPMDPVREIEDSLAVVKYPMEDKGLHLKINYSTLVPKIIQADSVRFRQVLINLLSNAIKFTSEGTIVLDVACVTNTDNEATLSIKVTDSGIGMDKLTQSNLFQPFVRGEDPNVQRVQGSGLGLALSLNLMRRMGGDLKLVSSTLGKGSTFEMTLALGPVANLELVKVEEFKKSTPEKVQTEKESYFLEGKSILVVDDSEDLRNLMRRYLLREKATVEVSENGAEAVEKAMANHFDVILMDIKMPVMDGYKATASLRAKGYDKPIVALTAQASVDGEQMSYKMGFDGYLSKPVDLSLLKQILKSRATLS
ncbi:response regulator [Bdellovibrio bacteriovorus]